MRHLKGRGGRFLCRTVVLAVVVMNLALPAASSAQPARSPNVVQDSAPAPARVPVTPAEIAAAQAVIVGVIMPNLLASLPLTPGDPRTMSEQVLSETDILSNATGISGAIGLLSGDAGASYAAAIMGALDTDGDSSVSWGELLAADPASAIQRMRQRLSEQRIPPPPPPGWLAPDSFFDITWEISFDYLAKLLEFSKSLPAGTQLSPASISSMQQTAPALALDLLRRVPVLDHFKCYEASGTHDPEAAGLWDQFDGSNQPAKQVNVLDPNLFCNPTRKLHLQGPGEISVGVRNADGHLTSYRIQPVSAVSAQAKTIQVHNQFGLKQKLTVKDPIFLLVPTQKTKVDGNAPPFGGGQPQGLDHFECYQVVGSDFVAQPARLQDQFDSPAAAGGGNWEDVIVQQPQVFCNPASKTHGNLQPTGIRNSAGHLACYLIADAAAPHSLVVSNQFGSDQALTSGMPKVLCVPSVKRVPQPNPLVVAGLAGLIADLGASQRSSLLPAVQIADENYRSGLVCLANEAMNTYLRDVQNLRRGDAFHPPDPGAEDLYNRGRAVRDSFFDVFFDSFFDIFVPPSPCFDASRGRGPIVSVQQSDNQVFAASVSFGGPNFRTALKGGESWTQLEIPGLEGLVGPTGRPAVPTWFGLVAVPQGAEAVIGNQVSQARESSIFLNLIPFQPEALDGEPQLDPATQPPPPETFADRPFVKDASAYSTDAFLPPNPCRLTLMGRYRDIQMAEVSCAAGQYNPVTDELRLFDSVQLSVQFRGGNGAFVTSQTLSPFEAASKQPMSVALNRAILGDYVQHIDTSRLPCMGEEFLILTHPNIRSAASALATWKDAKGISTSIFDVNDGPGGGPDTNIQIATFIEDRYDDCLVRPSYVLLMGDAELIPTFYPTGLADNAGSDLPYATYDKVLPAPPFPFFAVGRIPVDTLNQANAVVDKIVQYESSPPFLGLSSGGPFYTTASEASQFECCQMNQNGTPAGAQPGTDQRAFIEVSELVRNSMLTQGYAVERIYTKTVDGGGYCLVDPGTGPCPPGQLQQPYNGDSTPRRYFNGTLLPADLGGGSGFPWSGSTANIVNAFNDGRFLVLHRDHGWEGGWSNPGFATANANGLTNGGLLPVVFSVNCASGLFDNETAGGTYGTNAGGVYFSEALLRKADGGAIGVIGDTRNSPTWANNALTRGFFDAIWPNTVPAFGGAVTQRRLGDILNWGKVYLFTQVGVPQTAGGVTSGQAWFQDNIWHVIGDPTLEMWTGNPHRLKLSTIASVTTLADRLRLTYPVDGAQITALQRMSDGSARPIGRGLVINGVADLFYFAQPDPLGPPPVFSASLDNSVSVALGSAAPTVVELASFSTVAGEQGLGLLAAAAGSVAFIFGGVVLWVRKKRN